MKTRTRLEIIPRTVDTNQRRIILNVGGRKHETYLSTVRNYPDTRLYWVVENVTKAIDYDSERIELFFDRHPGIFEQVLNYYRTGKLHCPRDVCGPLFEEELTYWGIDEKEMEHCCWTSYCQHRDAEQNLKGFNVREGDQDRDTDFQSDTSEDHSPAARDCGRFTWWTKYQPTIWPILDDPRSSRAAKVFSIVSVALIMLSVGASCAMTLPQFSDSEVPKGGQSQSAFKAIDYFCGIWFTVELLLRILFCPRRRVFFRQLTNWIDILSVLPFYLQLFIPNGVSLAHPLNMIRLLRLFRFFRLLYGLQILLHTLKASSYELGLLLLILLIPVILFSSIIYYIEKENEQKKFRSIPESFWWSLITMTTVGYGDMVPATWAGKIIGGACSICGVLVVALPISIIGSNFNLYYAHAQARLKLPKKRNRLLLSSITSDFSGRRSGSGTRRRGLRMRSNASCDNENQVMGNKNGSKQLKSFPSKNSNDGSRSSRTYSIHSSKSDHSLGNNDVRLSPTATKGNRERKYSRNERVTPKLSDLPEKDETEENETSGNHLENLKPDLGVTNYSPADRLPLWLAKTRRVPRVRSSSVPSNAQRPPRNGPPPRKSKSQISRVCRRCSLPIEISSGYEGEKSKSSSTEVCCCSEKRDSPSSTYTIFIPGVDEGVQVSMENIPSWSRALPFDHGSPIQLDFVPSLKSTFSDEDSDSDDLRDQDEQDTVKGELRSDHQIDSRNDIPMLIIDMQTQRGSMSDKETLI